MNPSRTANIALSLALIGWLLTFYGVLSQLGDPTPRIAQATVEAHRQISAAILLVGIVVLLASLWLSGYSFAQAKWRASIAALLCIVPVIAIYTTTFFHHVAH